MEKQLFSTEVASLLGDSKAMVLAVFKDLYLCCFRNQYALGDFEISQIKATLRHKQIERQKKQGGE